MKGTTNMKTSYIVLTMALLLGSVSTYAQDIRPLMRASIPFGFTLGNQNFPAGDYIISSVGPQFVILLQSKDGAHVTFARANPAYAVKPFAYSKLVFQHRGSTYFLNQIWTQGDNSGRELLDSRRPPKEFVRNSSATDVATVVASAVSRH
jgi:hypothetical protein